MALLVALKSSDVIPRNIGRITVLDLAPIFLVLCYDGIEVLLQKGRFDNYERGACVMHRWRLNLRLVLELPGSRKFLGGRLTARFVTGRSTFLLCHTVELALKSFLAARGVTESKLRTAFGHKIDALMRE